MANIFRRFFQGEGDKRSLVNDVKASWLTRLNSSYNRSISATEAVEQVSTVYTCINILSSTVSRLPLSIYQINGINKSEVINHVLFHSLKYNPQSYYSSTVWLSTIVSHLYYFGNAYAYINPNNNQLEIIHPNYVTDIKEIISEVTGSVDLWYYVQSPTKEVNIIRSRDILHFKFISKDGFKGLAPLDSLLNEINIQHKVESTVNNFLSKNVTAPLFMETVPGADGKELTGAKLTEAVEDFNKKVVFNSTDSIVRIPPLHTIKSVGLNTDVINFLNSNKYTISQIGSVFGVPDYLLGINVNSQYGKYEEQSIAFRESTLKNIISMIEAEMNFKLLSPIERNEGIIIKFNLNQLDSIDTVTKINTLKIIKDAGALTPNELRAAFDLPISDNPAMNQFYMQAQYQVVSGSTSYQQVSSGATAA